MSRMEIFLLPLVLLAYLGAAQDDGNGGVDRNYCNDNTYCDQSHFCNNPTGSDRTVCAPFIDDSDILCSLCDRKIQACIVAGYTQVSCQDSQLDSCDNPCADSNQACVEGNDDYNACLPKANNVSGAVNCGDSKTYCNAGSFCVTADDDSTVCAPQTGNDDLCTACQKNGKICYQGTAIGQVGCVTYVNCAQNCSDSKFFCAVDKVGDATGACLEYSTKVGTSVN